MHPFGQHLDTQAAHDVSAQRCRHPQPIVVRAFRVQAHDQTRLADARRQRLYMKRQIEAAALLAALDEHYTTRVSDALRLQRRNRGERGKHRVPIIRPTPPIQLPVTYHRLPRTQPLSPACELRLLVEVSVHEHRIVRTPRDLDEQQRSAPRQPRNLHRQTFDRLSLAPLRQQHSRLVHIPMGFPRRIEQRRFIRDSHEVTQRRDDRSLPSFRDVGRQIADIHKWIDSNVFVRTSFYPAGGNCIPVSQSTASSIGPKRDRWSGQVRSNRATVSTCSVNGRRLNAVSAARRSWPSEVRRAVSLRNDSSPQVSSTKRPAGCWFTNSVSSRSS